MAEVFSGRWSLQVIRQHSPYQQRFTIRGSDNSDGTFPGTRGATIAEIRGARWIVAMEWSGDYGATWLPSDIHRVIEVTQADGLVVTLMADDNFVTRLDHDYNDLGLSLKYLDKRVNPPANGGWYDFTLEPDWIRHPGTTT